jgi:hypothetical protein
MKTSVSPHTVAFLILGLIAPLSAQNLDSIQYSSEACIKADGSQSQFSAAPALPGSFVVPALERAQGEISAPPPVITAQDSLSLDEKQDTARRVESVVDLNMLRNPSQYRKVMVSTKGAVYQVESDSLRKGLAQISAVYRESGKTEKSPDCSAVALSVEQHVKLDVSKVLEIVEREVGANTDCACEIVKAAIKASQANTTEVVAIVETAITVSPESMRIVSQCAIAASPDSVVGVQALLAKLDPNAGNVGDSAKSAKSAKGAKVASIVSEPPPNPLDRPYLPPLPPPPPPPLVTDVNPCPFDA